ncbi:MAG: hypothetical protein FWD71_14220 [Oscillospiraceae bacterium]|nr:hypothetical protein [Oscillospiraceae bacterium]
MKEPSVLQWSELYETANNIKKIAPWDYMWDSNLITVILPEHKEPFYCSVMGRNGECYAIGIYLGYKGIESLRRIVEGNLNGEPAFISGFEQNCLMCFFGDREELNDKDRDILKTLKLRFRGHNDWIYFRSMRPGYYPWHIDSEQADVLIQTLKNFIPAFTDLRDGKVNVDFENGETLIRSYSAEKDKWTNTVTRIEDVAIKVKIPAVIINDGALIEALKKQKKNSAALELEAAYLPAPIQENKNEAPYLGKIVILSDKRTCMPLGQSLIKPGEPVDEAIINILAGYIRKYGRPASLYVRDDRTAAFVDDLFRKIDVKLIIGMGMPSTDAILTNMLGFIQ